MKPSAFSRLLLSCIAVSALVALGGGCVASDSASSSEFYNDPPSEPELTADQAAALPSDNDPDHGASLAAALAAEQPQADAAAYDDSDVASFVDQEETDGVTVTAYAALLKWGLHPRASDALRAAGVSSWRIMQTIGNAAASAGTHAQDGTFNGHPYSAATDLSVSGLSDTEIRNLLEKLGKVGFAAWYRHNGHDGWYGVNHIHAVYANCLMKTSLRAQVRSWLAGRNGLVSNTIYEFHHFSAAARAAVHGKFVMSDYGTTNHGGGISGRVNTSGIPLHVRSGASLSSSIVGTVADGAYVTIHCQKRGGSVTGTYGTSTLWDKISAGYVSDAYVSTGSDGQIAPTCK